MVVPPFDVVGVGINSVDHVVVLPAFPAPSGPLAKMRVRDYEVLCGGQTATALVACARFGLRAKYVGAIGTDASAGLVREALSREGIDLSHLAVHDAVSRFAIILVDGTSGERVVLWDFDERLRLADAEVPRTVLESARLVHVDDVDGAAALSAARVARAAGVPVTSDIDRVTDLTRELIDTVTVAILAEHMPFELLRAPGSRLQASALARCLDSGLPRTPGSADGLADGTELRTTSVGSSASVDGPASQRAHSSLEDVRDSMLSLPRRPDQTVCVTLGDRGAIALDAGGFHYQPAFAVDAVDTTAAGDVFRAGFILARLRGYPIDQQLRWANAAAAISCTRLGAIASVPSLGEVEKLLAT